MRIQYPGLVDTNFDLSYRDLQKFTRPRQKEPRGRGWVPLLLRIEKSSGEKGDQPPTLAGKSNMHSCTPSLNTFTTRTKIRLYVSDYPHPTQQAEALPGLYRSGFGFPFSDQRYVIGPHPQSFTASRAALFPAMRPNTTQSAMATVPRRTSLSTPPVASPAAQCPLMG